MLRTQVVLEQMGVRLVTTASVTTFGTLCQPLDDLSAGGGGYFFNPGFQMKLFQIGWKKYRREG